MTRPSALKSIKRRWWLVVGFALLGALLGGLPQPAEVEEQATTFSARHTMLANETSDSPIISPNQVTLLATTGEVPRRVAENIGYTGNVAELAAQVQVEFNIETGALTFFTTQESPERAILVADSFADELNGYLVERQGAVYQERLVASRERLQELETELDDLTERLAFFPADATLLAQRDAVSRLYGLAFEQNGELEQDPGQLTFTTLALAEAVAQVDEGLSAPASRSTRAIMGFVIGSLLGSAAAVVLGQYDRRLRTREQAEELVAMRARVTIPSVRRTEGGVIVAPGRHDALSDAYRTVRNIVGFVQSGLDVGKRASVTLVVSPGPGDGKTSLAANLATAFGETGQRTIAVNTDFRRPRLHDAITGVPRQQLPYELNELDKLPRKSLPLETVTENMKVLDLSSIHASPGQLARSTMRQVERLAPGTDQIVIDTSPVAATAEVLELVPHADVIVLIVRVGHTTIKSAERTIAILRDISTAPLVFVLGGIKADKNPYYEYTDRDRSNENSPGPSKITGDSLQTSK